jgi:hypothetical protein
MLAHLRGKSFMANGDFVSNVMSQIFASSTAGLSPEVWPSATFPLLSYFSLR